MNHVKIAKNVFLISSIYDLALGVLFFLFYKPVFNFLNITIPSHPEYLQMSAAFVAVLGVGYFFVYKNITRNRDLWKLGILYKITYSLLLFYYYFILHTANVVFLYFAFIDVIFIALFLTLYGKIYAPSKDD